MGSHQPDISSSERHGGQGSLLRRIVMFYIDGFRSMTVGKKLWLLILIKLFILFFIFKLFFFPDILSRDYDTDSERAEAVREALLDRINHQY